MKEARAELTPVPAPSPGQQPHLARAVPRVLRVSHVAEAAEQLLHQEQGDLLQDGLLQVGCGRRASSVAEGWPRAHSEATFAASGLSLQSPGVRSALPARSAGPACRREPRAPGSALVPAQVRAPDCLRSSRSIGFRYRLWLCLGSCLSLRLQFRPRAPRWSSDVPSSGPDPLGS